MKFKISLSILVVFMVVLFAGFAGAQVSVENGSTTTVTAEQVKAANDKFIAARNEYQAAVKSGADKSVVEAAYVKFAAARDEYQKLSQAAGNCTPGSGQGAKNNGGKGQGNGSGLRDGSCQTGSTTGATTGSGQGKGKGKGNRGGCR